MVQNFEQRICVFFWWEFVLDESGLLLICVNFMLAGNFSYKRQTHTSTTTVFCCARATRLQHNTVYVIIILLCNDNFLIIYQWLSFGSKASLQRWFCIRQAAAQHYKKYLPSQHAHTLSLYTHNQFLHRWIKLHHLCKNAFDPKNSPKRWIGKQSLHQVIMIIGAMKIACRKICTKKVGCSIFTIENIASYRQREQSDSNVRVFHSNKNV